jgi:hypothetical protein
MNEDALGKLRRAIIANTMGEEMVWIGEILLGELEKETGHGKRSAQWKPIEGEIKRKVLVTNNIDARDANGQMSHVWIAGLVQVDDSKDKAGFITFKDSWQKICGLTHYAELPYCAPPAGCGSYK